MHEHVFVIGKNTKNGKMVSARVSFLDLIAFWYSNGNEEHGNLTQPQLEATAGESDPEGDLYALINRGQTVILNSEWYSALAFDYKDACASFVELELERADD